MTNQAGIENSESIINQAGIGNSQSVTNSSAIAPPDAQLQYRAIGLVRGQYIPSTENFNQGILLLEDDNTVAPANIVSGSTAHFLKKHQNLLPKSHVWLVYPRTKLQPPYLRLIITALRSKGNPGERDYFSVRGAIVGQDLEAGKFVVRVDRNADASDEKKKPKDKKHFLLTIQGKLPNEKAKGQFWDLNLGRDKDQLVLKEDSDATFVAQVFEPKPKNKKKRKKRRRSKAKKPNSSEFST